MKKILLHLMFLQVCFSLLAQKDSTHSGSEYLHNNYLQLNKKFSIAINIGAGVPMEDYGNKSQTPFSTIDTTHVTGLAKTGFHFNFTANYLFSQFFGATVMVGGTLNNFDIEQWQALRSAAVPGITTSVSGSFYIGEYLIGPLASLPVSNRVQIEFKALLGVISANYPTIRQTYPAYYSVNVPNYNFGMPLTQEKIIESSTDFGYYFGTGIKYRATNHIGINLNVGYTGSYIGYSNITAIYSQSGSEIYLESSTHTRYMQLGIFQPTAGISYTW